MPSIFPLCLSCLRAARGPALSLLLLCSLGACQSVHYYSQAMRGHLDVRRHERPLDSVIDDPSTPAATKTKLEMARKLCAFAAEDLKLPAKGQYARYADLGRPYVVWNVFAAPEFSLEAKTWWYPLVGRLAYRGFFSESEAKACAEELRGQGYDVYVGGIEVYSTLGLLRDPLLNTFIHHSEPILAENLFHELAHQRVFAAGDTDFNEAFATAVGEDGARRWLERKGDKTLLARYEAHLQRQGQMVSLFHQAREDLANLYGDQPAPGGKYRAATNSSLSPDQLRLRKAAILDRLQTQYESLRVSWGGGPAKKPALDDVINNARLNTVATYHDLVPAFVQLMAENGHDWEAFYGAASRLARLPKAERQAWLRGHTGLTGAVAR